MDYVFEFLIELLFDVSLEASQNQKVPKPIRYFLIACIILFFLLVISLIIIAGISCLSISKIAGVGLILVGILLLILSIIKFRKIYLIKRK